MGRKNSTPESEELKEIIVLYEAARAENRQLYLDGDQFADIADRYAADRKFIKAQEAIDYGLHLHPGCTSLLIEQAYLYMDIQKMQKAKEVIDSITEEYNTEVKMLKAELLLNEGQLEPAKEIINSIEEEDDMDTTIDIIYLYIEMGYIEEAKEWLERGKVKYSEDEEFINVIADYYVNTNQLETATLYFNQLIDIDPFNVSYWVGLAKTRFMATDCEKSIEACDYALAADEKCGEAYAYRGHCYFYLNNSDAAIENYTKAIEYKAFPPEMGYIFLAMAYSNKELWQEANDCYQRVIDAFVSEGLGDSPLLIDTFINKAAISSQLGNYKEAHQLCKRAESIDPKNPNVFLTEGKIYMNEGLEEKGIKSFDKALDLDPSVDMWYMIGMSYTEANMLYQAKLCFEEAYFIDPDYSDTMEKLCILCIMNNEIDDFFKYNAESSNPVSEDIILDLMSKRIYTEEGEQILKEVLERMRKEKRKK